MDRDGPALSGPAALRSPPLSSPPLRAAVVLPVLAVGLFVVAPLAVLLRYAVTPAAWATFSDPYTWRVVGYTLALATASTVATLVVGLPVAGALHRLALPGRRSLLALCTVPFVLPTVVVGLAFRVLLPSALTGTTVAVLLAHVFFNIAVVVRIVGGLWGRLDPRAEAVARTLGAGGLTVFRTLTWPLLRPAVSAAAVLVFLFCATSFGVVLVVGNPAWPTLEVEIYRRTAQQLDLTAAAALTVLQLAVVVVTLWVAGGLERRAAVRQPLATDRQARRRPRSAGDRWWAVAAYAVAALLAAPVLALVLRSLRVGRGWGLTHFRAVLRGGGTTASVPVADSLRVSVTVMLIATTLAVVIGAAAAIAVARPDRRNSALDTLVSLPVGVSAVALGFGLLLASVQGPVDLRGRWWLVPVAQALVALPLVIRAIVPVLRSIDPRLYAVAATLGAGPSRAWWSVAGPFLARGAAVGAGLAAAVSLGEFGATAFLVRAGDPTVPVQIVRLLNRPGAANLGQACALAVILMLLTAGCVAVTERWRTDSGGI